MIRHIVMFEFAKVAEGKTAIENAVIAKNKLMALQDKIDVIRKIEVGINEAEANATNYTLCLTCDFDSLEDLNTYITHPKHQEVGVFIGKVKLSRACVDYVF